MVRWLAISLLTASPLIAAGVTANSNCLPPANGAYVGQYEQWGPIVLSQPDHSAFTTCETPQSTTPGGSWTESFNSTITGELFVGGVDQGPIIGTAAVMVNLVVASDSGGVETLNTQMTELNITFSNGALGRIDPTTPSLGQTTITDNGNGTFQIQSFFDIFTDLSLDGGNTWIPGTGPGPDGSTVVTLQSTPEPSSFMLIGAGLLLLGARKIRHSRDS